MKKNAKTSENAGIQAVATKGDKMAELLAKAESINLQAVTEKTILNRSIYKPEILQGYKTDKTARRVLRTQQLGLSAKVVHAFKLGLPNGSLRDAITALEDFYARVLISRDKFSNIAPEKDKGAVIHLASAICKETK